jgi:4-carboxymuconolactone decarboxylase
MSPVYSLTGHLDSPCWQICKQRGTTLLKKEDLWDDTCKADDIEEKDFEMSESKRIANEMFGDTNPALADLTDDLLFGDVWERPALSKRDRSLITVAVLVAGYRTNELTGHIIRALDNGISEEELMEMFTHLAFYTGWPCAVTATNIARETLANRS